MPIQTPGSYEDEADEVAKRLVEGESDADEAKPAAPAPAPAPEKKDEPGPYGMTMAAWKALGPEGQWAKMLEQFNVKPDDARKLMRQILSRGFVTKKYPLWGGALNVTFRNPPGEHRLRVARELDVGEDEADALRAAEKIAEKFGIIFRNPVGKAVLAENRDDFGEAFRVARKLRQRGQ